MSCGILVDVAIAGHVASTSANSTNDVSSKVALFRAVIFPVANTTAVLADLVFVVTESTIESRKFSKLVAFVIVLPFGGRSSLKKDMSEL